MFGRRDEAASAPRSTRRTAAALACALLLPLGCAAGDPRADLRLAVERSVPEASRRDALLEFIEQRDASRKARLAERSAIVTRLRAANSDHTTPPAELAALLAEFEACWKADRDATIDDALAMRRLVTAEEWSELADADADALLFWDHDGDTLIRR